MVRPGGYLEPSHPTKTEPAGGGVVPTGPVDLGVFALKGGTNELTATCIGTNPQATPKDLVFGLDSILLGAEQETERKMDSSDISVCCGWNPENRRFTRIAQICAD